MVPFCRRETRAQSSVVPQHPGLSPPRAPSPHLALSPGLRDSSMAPLDVCLMQPPAAARPLHNTDTRLAG